MNFGQIGSKIKVSLDLCKNWHTSQFDLLRKSMDWFLYDNGLRHERVNANKYHRTQTFPIFTIFVSMSRHFYF